MIDVLLADDEPSIRLTLGDALRAEGYRVSTVADGQQALALVTSQVFDVVITDIRMPKADGLSVLRKVRAESPTTDVILITAHAEVEDAVTALKEGAADYLTKPFELDEMTVRVQRLAERRQLQRELDAARLALSRASSSPIIGRSPAMARLRKRIDTIAPSEVSVVIVGESGTGKELVARALHEGSPRSEAPFVAVSCAAFPETLIEAELFGHQAGAFTGANKARDGRFKTADGGTLFLDEVGEVPLTVQAKLLRVLQDGAVEPLGTNRSINVDVRVLCATHRDLKQMIAEGTFREDLYYRLKVLDINVPALRDRRGDLPLLVEYFLDRFTKAGAERPTISPRAWAALSEYPFPGNVRELEHTVQHAVVLAGGGEIDLEHLPDDIAGLVAAGTESTGGKTVRPLAVAAREFEREYLLRALELSDGKRTEAAERLGISRKTLWEKLRAHGIGG